MKLNVKLNQQIIKDVYKHHLNKKYIQMCYIFEQQDKNIINEIIEFHHIIPKCLNTNSDDVVRITHEHHKKLHNLILQSYRLKKKFNIITQKQYFLLKYAANKMNNKI